MADSEFNSKSEARNQAEVRFESELISQNDLNIPIGLDLQGMLNFLRKASPEALIAHENMVAAAHARAKIARIQWQKDHKAGLLRLKERA